MMLLVRDETTVTLKHLFIYFIFYKRKFCVVMGTMSLKLHVNKDLQPKPLCPRPCSSSEALAQARTSGLPRRQTWRMSRWACHTCRAWSRWGQARWCTGRGPPQILFLILKYGGKQSHNYLLIVYLIGTGTFYTDKLKYHSVCSEC